MKRKLILCVSVLCLLTGITLLAEVIPPSGPCSFIEDDAIYMCTGDDCLCNAPAATCRGIKIKVMDLHPSEIEL